MTPGRDIEVTAGLAAGDLKRELREMEAAVEKSMSRLGSKEASPRVDLNSKEFKKDIGTVNSMMAALDRAVASGKVKLDSKEFDERYKRIQAKLAIMDRKRVRIEVDIDSDPSVRALMQLENAWTKVKSTFSKGDGGLLNTPIHFFNMTLKAKQLIAVFAVLAPMIEGVIGAIGSLGAVLGTGIAGVLAAGVSAAASFTVGLGSIGLVAAGIIPTIKDTWKNIGKYDDAVKESGKNSSQAAAGIKKLQESMGGVSKDTAKQVGSVKQLWTEWQKLTKPSARTFWNTAAEGIKTARSNMKLMAQEGNENFRVLSKGAQSWFKQLRSDGAKNTLSQLSGIFQAVTPQIMASIANIVSALAHIGVAAAPIFGRFTAWLQRWSGDWRKATAAAGSMSGTMKQLSDSAANVGKFFGAAGRLIWTAMKGGADAGGGLLNSMTGILNKWTAWMQAHPEKVAEWFRNAGETAGKVVQAVTQIATAFLQWSALMRPVANVVLDVLNALLSVKGVAVPLAGAMTAIWAVAKIATFIKFVNDARNAMIALNLIQTAGGKGGFLSSLMSLGGRGAATTGLLARLAPLGAALVNPYTLAAGAIVGTAVALEKLTADHSYEDSLKALTNYANGVKATFQATQQLPAAYGAERSALQQLSQARKNYNKDRTKANLIALDSAEASAAQASAQRQSAAHKNIAAAIGQQQSAMDRVAALQSTLQDGSWIEKQAAIRQIVPALKEVEFANDRVARAQLNIKRAAQGLAPVMGEAGMKMGQVYKIAQQLGPKLAAGFKNFTVNASYSQVTKASTAISNLKSRAGQRAAITVVANTKSPETALRRLDILGKAITRAKRILRVDGDASRANRVLTNTQLKAMSLTRKQWKAAIGIKDNATPKMQTMSKLFGLTTKDRKAKVDVVGATQATGQVQTLQRMMKGLKPASPRVSAPGTPAAYNAVGALKNQLNSLPTRKDIYVTTHQKTIKERAGGGRTRLDERLTLVNERGPESATAPDGTYLSMLGDGREGITSLEPGTVVHTAAETRSLWKKLGIEAMANGGTKKGKKKHSNRVLKQQRRKVRKFRQNYGPVESAYRRIKTAIEARKTLISQKQRDFDQDQRQYPYYNEDGTLNEANSAILKQDYDELAGLYGQEGDQNSPSLTGSLISMYGMLKKRAQELLEAIGSRGKNGKWSGQIGKWEKEKSRIQNDRRLTSGAKSSALARINKILGELRDDRGDVLQDIGEADNDIIDAKQNRRGLDLDWADLIKAPGTGSGSGSSSIADQAVARAAALSQSLGVSEAAFRVFNGSGDIGSGGPFAFGAAISGTAAADAIAAGRPGSSPSSEGGSSGPTVNVYASSLVPGDSKSLAAVGNAAAAGFGQQGSNQTPRTALGI